MRSPKSGITIQKRYMPPRHPPVSLSIQVRPLRLNLCQIPPRSLIKVPSAWLSVRVFSAFLVFNYPFCSTRPHKMLLAQHCVFLTPSAPSHGRRKKQFCTCGYGRQGMPIWVQHGVFIRSASKQWQSQTYRQRMSSGKYFIFFEEKHSKGIPKQNKYPTAAHRIIKTRQKRCHCADNKTNP